MKSQYDLWVEAEQNKIHKEHQQKRQEVLEKSLVDGFDNPDRKSQKGQMTADFERLAQEEQAAINEFMTQIQSD